MHRFQLLAIAFFVLVLTGCSLAGGGGESTTAEDPQAIAANQKATHKERAAITLKGKDRLGQIAALCLTPDGKLLICDSEKDVIRVMDRDGTLVATWKPGIKPQAVAVVADGTVFVAGAGQLAKLGSSGAVLKKIDVGKQDMASMTASDKDVFVAVRGDTGFTILRFNHDLEGRQKIADGLRGCCGTLDLATHNNELYVAENSRKQIARFDRDGKQLARWGEGGDKKIEEFGSCCNPMNLCVAGTGEVYTAESGPDRVKRYTGDGKYLGLVGWFTGGKSCSCVDLAVSTDGGRVYVADTRTNTVRVLEQAPPESQPAPPAAPQAKPGTDNGPK